MVETVEGSVVGVVRILRGQKYWPTWVEEACGLGVGEEDREARAQFWCHICVQEKQGQQLGRIQQDPQS